MRHPIFSILLNISSTAIATTMPPSPLPTKPRKSSSSSSHHHHSPSATATLDFLILILVLFSGTFLLTSYFSYIFNSLSLLLPALFLSHSALFDPFPLLYILGFVLSFAIVFLAFEICCFGSRSRRCGNPKCKGLKKAMEFDLQLQTEECLKSGNIEIDRLPWKGGSENNPDYECLRAELRKMSPPNGRAVLLFRVKCGCPIAKLVGWGAKKGRKHKKALANVGVNGDHR